ncbi:ubiquinol oxidase subunit II [Aureimonas ureilytica]|uniref:ubiquinol oxidase subunit II n=1 Tax=Aureimonas ureilytica TaxID=401562 RepID=UPI003CF20E94
MSRLRFLALAPFLLLIGGCNAVLLNPAGDVALQKRDLLYISTGLMLLIIIPVIAATVIFAWRYRRGNRDATYDPEWNHSTHLELAIWSAPLLIIICLGALTWTATHLLDPYRPLTRIAEGQPVTPQMKPIEVRVVSMDWKWLFIYPELGIATVNELAAPVNTPINFKLTSTSVMNAFFVPSIAGMIYTMNGMETQLHAVANEEGVYDGMSSHYSGAGFSNMRFKFHSLSQQGFDAWVAKVRAEGQPLSRETFLELEKPSEKEPVRYYSSFADGLYNAILNKCVAPGKMCADEMMQIDAMGGAGVDSHQNRERLMWDTRRAEEGDEPAGATFPASGRMPHSEDQPQGMKPDQLNPEVNQDGTRTAPANPSGNVAPNSGTGVAPAQLNQTN